MLLVGSFCILLLVLTVVIHYEVLRLLTVKLPALQMPARAKLIVVIFTTFFCARRGNISLRGSVLRAGRKFRRRDTR